MDVYKRDKKKWQDKSFRMYVSEELKKQKLKEYDKSIEKLQKEKKELDEAELQILTFNEGNSVTKLKKLPFKEDEFKTIVQKYEQTHPVKKNKFNAILKFFSELMT